MIPRGQSDALDARTAKVRDGGGVAGGGKGYATTRQADTKRAYRGTLGDKSAGPRFSEPNEGVRPRGGPDGKMVMRNPTLGNFLAPDKADEGRTTGQHTLHMGKSIFGANRGPRGGGKGHSKALTAGIVETEEEGAKTSGGGTSEAGYFATRNALKMFRLKAGRGALNHDFDSKVWSKDNATDRGRLT